MHTIVNMLAPKTLHVQHINGKLQPKHVNMLQIQIHSKVLELQKKDNVS